MGPEAKCPKLGWPIAEMDVRCWRSERETWQDAQEKGVMGVGTAAWKLHETKDVESLQARSRISTPWDETSGRVATSKLG